ncbi:MAG TPA: hypothetical protein VF541_09730, partial [Longimicrobium sp.]
MKDLLNAGALGDLPWGPADADNSLQTVYVHVMDDAVKAMDWYDRKRKPKKRGGLSIRVLAVLLISIAGLL